MRFKTLVLGTLFMFGLLLTSGMSYGYERAIEAEMVDAIEAPMVVADDANASGGQFIWMEGAPVAGGGGEGWAEYNLHISAPGTYALWGKVIAWDGNSDSFWVTWQPADPDENAQETQNTEFRWGVAQGNDWHWDRINHWLDGGTFDREWKLDAGETLLRIAVREDATMLDAIFATTNAGATTPLQANVRLPDDTDRKIQIEGLAVNAKGKAATTWGSLKRRINKKWWSELARASLNTSVRSMFRLQINANRRFDKPVVPKHIASFPIMVNTPKIKSTFKLNNTLRWAKMESQFLHCPPVTRNKRVCCVCKPRQNPSQRNFPS